MKMIYILMFVSLNIFAANSSKENPQNILSITENEDPIKTTAVAKKNNSISGLKIVTCTSKKYGKHIYVISDMYVMKKVRIYNTSGEKVLAVSTVGSPIYIAKMEKGNYKVKVIEGKRTEITELVVK